MSRQVSTSAAPRPGGAPGRKTGSGPGASCWAPVGMRWSVPSLTLPVIPEGRVAGSVQPVVPAGGGLVLRPWLLADARARRSRPTRTRPIQRWHARRVDSADEARELIAALAAQLAGGYRRALGGDQRRGRRAGRPGGAALDDARRGMRRVRLLDGSGRPRLGNRLAVTRRTVPLGVRRDRLPPHRARPFRSERGVLPRRGQGRLRGGRCPAQRCPARRRVARHAPSRAYQRSRVPAG